MMSLRSRGVAVVFLCVCSLGIVHAKDKAPSRPGVQAASTAVMFGGTPSRNLVNTVEKNMPIEWEVKKGKQKNVKWLATLGKTTYGGPLVAGGKVYVGTNNDNPRDPKVKGDKGIVMCFDAATGKFLWQAVHDKLPNPDENDWPKQGIASTPAVEGDRLYYVSNRCELVCASTHDGKPLWRLNMIKELGVWPHQLAVCSPLIAGDLVFVVTGNGITLHPKPRVPAPKAPSFIAVNKNTGKLVWKDSSPGENIMEGQWSNPAYGEVEGKPQVIFPGGDGWLYSFEPKTGKLIWKFDCNPKSSTEFKVGGGGNRNYPVATPVFYQNKVYVSVGRPPDDGADEGHLWCIDATKTGDISAEVKIDGKIQANKNSGVVWHFGGPAPEGSPRSYVFGRTLCACAIHDGLLYIAELDGFVYCLDANTGQKHWEYDFKSSIWGSLYWVDGKLYVGDLNSNVHIFAHGKDMKLLSTIEVNRPVRCPLAAADGVLYLMTDSELIAIASK